MNIWVVTTIRIFILLLLMFFERVVHQSLKGYLLRVDEASRIREMTEDDYTHQPTKGWLGAYTLKMFIYAVLIMFTIFIGTELWKGIF